MDDEQWIEKIHQLKILKARQMARQNVIIEGSSQI